MGVVPSLHSAVEAEATAGKEQQTCVANREFLWDQKGSLQKPVRRLGALRVISGGHTVGHFVRLSVPLIQPCFSGSLGEMRLGMGPCAVPARLHAAQVVKLPKTRSVLDFSRFGDGFQVALDLAELLTPSQHLTHQPRIEGVVEIHELLLLPVKFWKRHHKTTKTDKQL